MWCEDASALGDEKSRIVTRPLAPFMLSLTRRRWLPIATLVKDNHHARQSNAKLVSMVDTLIAAFVTLLVVIDPPGVVPIFAGLTGEASPVERRRMAVHGTLIGAGILLAFALGGEVLLRLLGVGLPAFRIAGGVLLLLLAIEMVMAKHSGLRATTSDEEKEGNQRADITVFPLAIPLIAGPGAMTSIVLLMGREPHLPGKAMILGILGVVLAIMLACLLLTGPVIRLLGVTGINVISRVAGIILAALAVQFVIDGVRAAWPGA